MRTPDYLACVALIVLSMALGAWAGSAVSIMALDAQCVMTGKYTYDSFIFRKPLAIECKITKAMP